MTEKKPDLMVELFRLTVNFTEKICEQINDIKTEIDNLGKV